jgi:hypothetical protein
MAQLHVGMCQSSFSPFFVVVLFCFVSSLTALLFDLSALCCVQDKSKLQRLIAARTPAASPILEVKAVGTAHSNFTDFAVYFQQSLCLRRLLPSRLLPDARGVRGGTSGVAFPEQHLDLGPSDAALIWRRCIELALAFCDVHCRSPPTLDAEARRRAVRELARSSEAFFEMTVHE